VGVTQFPSVVPLLRFVELVRQRVPAWDATIGERLRVWLEETAALISRADDEQARLLTAARLPSSTGLAAVGAWWCLIQVRPARDAIRAYKLKAWLMQEDGRNTKTLWESEVNHSQDEILRVLSSRPEDGGDGPGPLDEVRDRLAEEGVPFAAVRLE